MTTQGISTSLERRQARQRHFAGLLRGTSWAFALPAILLLLGFHILPTIAGGYYAFTDWNGLSADASFVGFANFATILENPATRAALVNTFQLTFFFVALANAIGLGLALALHRRLKTRFVLRSLFFLPVVLAPVAVAFIWQFVFDRYGVINEALRAVGLGRFATIWLAHPTLAMYAVIAVMVWQFSGLCMVIYLAGLENVPEELVEAAAVDGARPLRIFRKITFPLLAPAVTVAMTMTLVYGLRAFDQVVALTGGGPVYATETLATQVWKQTFSLGNYSRGTAMALILTTLIALLGVAQAALLRRRELS